MYYFHETTNRMRSWLRTDAFNAAVAAALATPQPDVSLMQAYLKIIYDDCSVIPIYEGIGGFASVDNLEREGGWEIAQALVYLEKIWFNTDK
jgi:hypothetical protein